MLVPETDIREACPSCGLKVARCGDILTSIGMSYAEPANYIGDVIDESIPCDRCGTELIYQVEREWDDRCYVCGCRYDEWKTASAEWQKNRGRYRWWCLFCEFNFLASLLAEWSPILARALWFPLLILTPVFLLLMLAWFGARDWLRISN